MLGREADPSLPGTRVLPSMRMQTETHLLSRGHTGCDQAKSRVDTRRPASIAAEGAFLLLELEVSAVKIA